MEKQDPITIILATFIALCLLIVILENFEYWPSMFSNMLALLMGKI